jgi:hypothetical protein
VSDALVSAVVAGVVSVIVTFGKIAWDSRQKKQDRRVLAREKLDRYREPLLAAADALGTRVNNVRHHNFLSYLDVPERRRTALLGTLFRFAQLFGWIEILYGTYDRLRSSTTRAPSRWPTPSGRSVGSLRMIAWTGRTSRMRRPPD